MKFSKLDIKELHLKIAKELSLKNKSVPEVAKENAALQHYYLGLLFKEKKKLKKLELLYKESKTLAYKKHRFSGDINLSQREANKLSEIDENVKNLNELLEEQIEIVEYLEGVIQIFNNRSFTLNSLINYYAKHNEFISEGELI